LVLGKVIKIVADRCHILKLRCTKFDFGYRAPPQTSLGSPSAPHTPWLDFRGPTSNGGRRKDRSEWQERGRRERRERTSKARGRLGKKGLGLGLTYS